MMHSVPFLNLTWFFSRDISLTTLYHTYFQSSLLSLPFLSTYHSILMKHNFMFVFVSHPWLLRTFGFSAISIYNSYLIPIFGTTYFQNVLSSRFWGHWGQRTFEVKFWDRPKTKPPQEPGMIWQNEQNIVKTHQCVRVYQLQWRGWPKLKWWKLNQCLCLPLNNF